jgi:hypothetical protein
MFFVVDTIILKNVLLLFYNVCFSLKFAAMLPAMLPTSTTTRACSARGTW